MPVLIQSVLPRSPAKRAGILPGDTLLEIDGHPICDVLDYRFYMTSRALSLSLLRGGAPYSVDIQKDEYDDLGLEFETYLMDKQHSCKNKCIFCFIDQMPPGMRDTLYFKDDDSRMSFLFGNYITLTNLTDKDIDRIIEMHISPVNVSVHTTDPQLRVRMMKNPHAAGSLRYLRRLTQAGIKINTQLVLVPEYNDGEALQRTLTDLDALTPNLQSIACVPVGLTKYRDGLEELRPFQKEEAQKTIEMIDLYAEGWLQKYGTRIAYPSDEFFLLAGLPLPPSDYYGEFEQLENGVGLMALLKYDFEAAIQDDETTDAAGRFTMLTGVAAGPLIQSMAASVMKKHPRVKIEVHPIVNHFFGEQITVAGLVTGCDIKKQVQPQQAGTRVLLPSVMLRREGDCFLDNVTLTELRAYFGVPVEPVDNDGFLLYDAMTGRTPGKEGT